LRRDPVARAAGFSINNNSRDQLTKELSRPPHSGRCVTLHPIRCGRDNGMGEGNEVGDEDQMTSGSKLLVSYNGFLPTNIYRYIPLCAALLLRRKISIISIC
jgi:hypothetical protein